VQDEEADSWTHLMSIASLIVNGPGFNSHPSTLRPLLITFSFARRCPRG